MAKIFITGSTEGIGLLAAEMLLENGHEVVLHARSQERANEALEKFQIKPKILIADLLDIEQIKTLINDLNTLGKFDTIIHNAGVYHSSHKDIFQVNVLAPYILTTLVKKPKRLIYIGSNMHPRGNLDIENITLEGGVDYSTSKLYILMLSFAFSKQYKDIYINTVDPGWVPTKMANYSASDSLEDGTKTQVALAVEDMGKVTGKYFFHLKEINYFNKADDKILQNKLLQKLDDISKGFMMSNFF